MNNSVETKKEEVRKNIKNTLESAKIKIINVISVCPDWEVEYIDFGFKSLNVCLNLKGVERNRSLVIRYQKKWLLPGRVFQHQCGKLWRI